MHVYTVCTVCPISLRKSNSFKSSFQFWVDKRCSTLRNSEIDGNHMGTSRVSTVMESQMQMEDSLECQPTRTKTRRTYCRSRWRRIKNAFIDLQPETVDKYSAILFPTAYFIFNVGYWGYYLSSLSAIPENTL